MKFSEVALAVGLSSIRDACAFLSMSPPGLSEIPATVQVSVNLEFTAPIARASVRGSSF